MSIYNTEKNYLKEIVVKSTNDCMANKKSFSSSSTFFHSTLKLFYLSLFFVVGIFLSSCGSQEELTPTDPINPTAEELKISSVNIDGKDIDLTKEATKISLSPVLIIEFSQKMTAVALKSSQTVTLKKENENIPFTIEQGVNEKTITVTPNDLLLKSTAYSLTIAKDLSVKIEEKTYKLSKDAILTFTTTDAYTVTFDLNAIDATGTFNSLKVVHDGKVTRPTETPTRTTHTFANWVTTTATDAPNFNFADTKITGDTVIYAKWTTKSYQVTFNLNAIDATGTFNPLTVVHEGMVTRPTETPIRTGYTFANWVTTTATDAPNFNFSDTKITGDTIIYAKWTTKSYQVTFNLNAIGATGTFNPLTVVHDGKVTRPTETPTRTTHTFANWVTTTATDAPNFNFADTKITGDTVIYAKWTTKSYQVTFNLNAIDATGTIDPLTVAYDSKVTHPTVTPTRTGYTFANWVTTTATDAPNFNFADTKITGDTIIYAKWTTKSYQVTFNLNGIGATGTINPLTVAHDGKVTRPTVTPTRTGYTFANWITTTATDAPNFNFADTKITGDTIIYAKWTTKSYQVTFNLNGIGATGTIDPLTVAYDSKVTRPTVTPTRTGYTFANWVTTTATDAPNFNFADTKIIGDTVIYAKWATKSYQVTFNLNGIGATGTIDPLTVAHDGKVTRPTVTPTRTGYTFANWVTTTATDAPNFNFADTKIIGDTVIYAKWATKSYQVTFNLNGIGATGTIDPLTVAHDGKVTRPTVTPTRTGYTFTNWVTTTATDAPNFNFADTKITGDTIIYAKWTAKTYLVIFSLGTGVTGTVDSQNVAHDGYAVAPVLIDIPTRTNYTFDKWVTTADGDIEFVFTSTKIIAPTTIYAKWVTKSYQVTFNLNGIGATGTIDPLTVAHDGKVTRPTVTPTRTGYTFANWVTTTATDAPNFNFADTKITGDTIIYAKWTAKTYLVTFSLGTGVTGTVDSQNVAHDGYAVAPVLTDIPTRTKYTFDKWVTTADGDTEFVFTSTKIIAPTTIYAKWVTKSYQISFNLNGIGATGTVDSQNVAHDGYATLPTQTISRTGYTFDKWVTTADGDTEFLFTSTKIIAPTTIYAKWTPYITTFDLTALTLEIGGIEYIGRIVGTFVKFSVPNKSITSGIIKVITVFNATADKSVNDIINFAGGTSTNVISVNPTVGTSIPYTLQLLSNVAKITAITLIIEGRNYPVTFSDGVTSATISVLDSTVASAIITLVTPSLDASVNPVQGSLLNFENKVATLEVTAEDEIAKVIYRITLVTADLSLTSVGLTINGSIAAHKIQDTNVFVAVENKATVNTASITSIAVANGATTVPARGETLTFSESNGVKTSRITVSQGAFSRVYTVTLQNNTNSISNFVFTSASNTASGITEDKVGVILGTSSIAIPNLPVGSTLTNLIPSITHNGQSISPASNTRVDFSTQATYVVTSEYGSERSYTISVSKASVSTHTVTFNLGTGVTGTIDSQDVTHNGYAVTPQLTDIPTRTTHKFDKWVTTAGGDTEFVFTSTKITAPTTIYAKWIVKSSTKELTALTLEIGGTDYIGRIEGILVKFSVANKAVSTATVKVITTPNATADKSVNDTINFTSTGIETNAITVTAEDSTQVQYTLQLFSNVAKLTTISLSIASTDYTATFSSTETSKTLQVSDDTVSTATITLVMPSPGASVNPVQGAMLSFTSKVATLEVTAEDGIVKETYTITLQKGREELTGFPKKLTNNEPANVNPSPITTSSISLYVRTARISTLTLTYNNKDWIKHDVTATKIEYNSDVLGTAKTLSGLAVLPHDGGANAYDKTKPLPILLVCHGTEFVRSKVASNFKYDGTNFLPVIENLSGFELGATAGAMVVIPDYAGLGVDTNTFHPYFIKEPSGKNPIDAVYAAAELAISKGYKVSKDLFIVGYSEGGYVSLASTEYAEKNAASHFNIVESYCGAGAYLPHEMWETVLAQTAYPAPAFVSYVGKAYVTFNIIPSLDDLLIPSIITKMDELLDGTKNFNVVNAGIFTALGTGKTFNDMFLPAVVADVKSQGLYTKLQENSFADASFKSNIIFYHSREDTIIPFVNTESTITKIRQNNNNKNTGGTVTLEVVTGDHIPAFNLMLGKVMEKLVGHIQE